MYKTTERQAFVTIKDHKENYRNNPKWRLLNPTKPELGKISKRLTEKINVIVKIKTKLNLLKNTNSATQWYSDLRQKHKLTFIQLDVIGMYGSITEELFLKALKWAEQFIDISEEEKEILLQSKKSTLYHDNKPWEKKGGKNFDVTEGSYDGAETC